MVGDSSRTLAAAQLPSFVSRVLPWGLLGPLPALPECSVDLGTAHTPETQVRPRFEGTFPPERRKPIPLSHQVSCLLNHSGDEDEGTRIDICWKHSSSPLRPSAQGRAWAKVSFLPLCHLTFAWARAMVLHALSGAWPARQSQEQQEAPGPL